MRLRTPHEPLARAAAVVLVAFATSSCVPEPPVVTPTAPSRTAGSSATWEQKLAWIVRLEDQRILRDPNPPPPPVVQPAAGGRAAVLGAAAPADLLPMLRDGESRVRRRAALAVGRVGLAEGVPYLAELLRDKEPEVRQMAAFALGLIGDAGARGALLESLSDASPLVQGRAAEALGMVGDKADAAAVSAMVQGHVRAGALSSIDPDSLEYPLAPPAEAARLGLFALARLGVWEALASAALDQAGQPVSRWWPVAYALQRVGDARAAPALTALLATPGRYTLSFAIRGLAAAKVTTVASQLRAAVEERKVDRAVVIQAVRALAALGDRTAAPLLGRLAADASVDDGLRLESMTAFASLVDASASEVLVDLLFDAKPFVRAQATHALARVAPDAFTQTLSGLDPDTDWSVRAAQATALGGLPEGRGVQRLTLMLEDADRRVVPTVMAALVAAKAPNAEALMRERLTHQDLAVRAAAAQGLVDLKAVGAVPAMWAAYQAAAAEDAYGGRGAMLSAIHRLDAAAARPLLESALADKDWAIRVRAADLLRADGVTGDVPTRMRPAVAGASVDDPQWRAAVLPAFSPVAYIDTDKGTIEVELAVLDAPLTVRSFIALARKGFYTGVSVHRVVHDFVVQAGDPRGDGEGGPGYTLRDEINQRPYLRGAVGMALDWEDTGGSQFFITHAPAPHLDGRYTVFGRVVSGMEVVDRIVQGDRIRGVRIRDGVVEP